MRLTRFEQKEIKKAFLEIFEEGKVYLFGSRVDDTQRGGDIDLYLCPVKEFQDMRKKKTDFLVKLDLAIGEQKIDLVVAKDKNRTIEQVALRDGIEL